MRKTLLIILLIEVSVMVSEGARAKENPLLEKIEWTDIWVTNANQNDLPRVLLVGDSITRGYFAAVEKDLAGKANCARYTTSMFLANPDYLDGLKIILKSYRFSVIHINNGLHGWGYTEEQYRQSLPKLMDTVKKYGKGAVLIWATTTPRRSKENPVQFAPDTDRVRERDRIAAEYMNQHGIEIDDLYSLVAEHPEYYGGDHTHFNAQGQAVEGTQVSEIILRGLTSKSAAGKGQK
jgi:hypothetical protein